MQSIKDEFGIWFELHKVCDMLSLSILEVFYSPLKPYIPKEFMMIKKNVLYINSMGFLILAAYDRSGRTTMSMIRQIILDAFRFWAGLEIHNSSDNNKSQLLLELNNEDSS